MAYPFESAAYDIAGPLYTKNEGKIEKNYILVITCLLYRAVHLELMLRKDTNEVLNALRKCFARRGRIKKLISDSDGSFLNTGRHLTELYKEINFKQLKQSLAMEGTTFEFNVPYSPHRMGIIEAIVKIVKTVLNKKLTRSNLTTWNLITLVYETECLTNQRPLCIANVDQKESIITPNTLMNLRDGELFPPYKSTKNF